MLSDTVGDKIDSNRRYLGMQRKASWWQRAESVDKKSLKWKKRLKSLFPPEKT